jgi:hypothetical protein
MEITSNRSIVAVAVFTSLLSCAARAEAQVGVLAGLARSGIAVGSESGSPDLAGPQDRSGLAAGVSLLLPANRYGGWQIEALFIEKGAANVLGPNDALRLSYLEIPFLLHVDVLRRRGNALFLLAGPSLAFPLSASYETDGVKENIKDDVSSVDVGLHVGGGVEVGQLIIDARYIWGWRTVFSGDLDGAFKNRTFSVMAGIRLGR